MRLREYSDRGFMGYKKDRKSNWLKKMSKVMVARTIPSILAAVKGGAKLEVVSNTKTWTAGGVKGSKTWGVLHIDGKETPIEFHDVRCPRGLHTKTFDNKLSVSLSAYWSVDQLAEIQELENLIVREGVFVTYRSKLTQFEKPEEFQKYKWTGAAPPAQPVKDKSGLIKEGEFYPRSSYIDCPFSKTKDDGHAPNFELKNVDGTDVEIWGKLEGSKLNVKRMFVSYEIVVPPNGDKNFKVKLICRGITLNEGGNVTVLSESQLENNATSSNKRVMSEASSEPDNKRRRVGDSSSSSSTTTSAPSSSTTESVKASSTPSSVSTGTKEVLPTRVAVK